MLIVVQEIEMVISRLEEEAESSRTQNDRAADARIKLAEHSRNTGAET